MDLKLAKNLGPVGFNVDLKRVVFWLRLSEGA